MNIKETINNYEPITTKNITDLQEIDINEPLTEETFKDNEGKDFKAYILTRGKDKYRVPISVIAQLKTITEKKPGLKSFSVGKTGSGMETRYTVIPL